MDLAAYLVAAVDVEGRSVRAVAREYGVSKSWVAELVSRYRTEGEAGLVPRSRRPHRSPTKVADRYEEEIVAIRKDLVNAGYDAGPDTIWVHLRRAHRRSEIPSRSTIWRILKAGGFVVPEPHKRPKSSYVRFVAALPNECWQMDITHLIIGRRREVEVLNIIDDHSRLCLGTFALPTFKAADVLACFYEAAGRWDLPASVLSDNGAVFTAAARHGVCVMESELLALGVAFKHSKPYHPQTCGKVERFHQTMKKHLTATTPARTLEQLEDRVRTFAEYYNTIRPHRGIGRRTPAQAFDALPRARPTSKPFAVPPHCRVRQDKVHTGKVTLRYRSRLYHVAVGRRHEGQRVLVLVADRDVRVLDYDGQVLRHLTIDPKRPYQPLA